MRLGADQCAAGHQFHVPQGTWRHGGAACRITNTTITPISSPIRTASFSGAKSRIINYITASPAFYTNTAAAIAGDDPAAIQSSIGGLLGSVQRNHALIRPGSTQPDQPRGPDSKRRKIRPARPPPRRSAGDDDATSWIPQYIAFNEYYGWYGSPLNGIGLLGGQHSRQLSDRCIGISEYGAGASIYQHSENPVPAHHHRSVSSGGMAEPGSRIQLAA